MNDVGLRTSANLSQCPIGSGVPHGCRGHRDRVALREIAVVERESFNHVTARFEQRRFSLEHLVFTAGVTVAIVNEHDSGFLHAGIPMHNRRD